MIFQTKYHFFVLTNDTQQKNKIKKPLGTFKGLFLQRTAVVICAVYYCGTQEEWNKIEFENPHAPLKSIKVYFYNEKSTNAGIY